jgi:hypothetical protein
VVRWVPNFPERSAHPPPTKKKLKLPYYTGSNEAWTTPSSSGTSTTDLAVALRRGVVSPRTRAGEHVEKKITRRFGHCHGKGMTCPNRGPASAAARITAVLPAVGLAQTRACARLCRRGPSLQPRRRQRVFRSSITRRQSAVRHGTHHKPVNGTIYYLLLLVQISKQILYFRKLITVQLHIFTSNDFFKKKS